MEIEIGKLKKYLDNLKCSLKEDDEQLNELLRLQITSEVNVKKVFQYLCDKLLDAEYTEKIGIFFKSYTLLIVICVIQIEETDSSFDDYQRKSIALSCLAKQAPEILSYARKFFTGKPAPFDPPLGNNNPKKRIKSNDSTVTDLQIIKCCYNLLTLDPIHFRHLWKWSVFLEKYLKCECPLQKLYTNHVIAILANLTSLQLKCLNEKIPEKVLIQFEEDLRSIELKENDLVLDEKDKKSSKIILNIPNDTVVNVEGVLLPVFNKENKKFYHTSDNKENVVKVESTKINLRSIALGISSVRAICLSGPVGCGKTSLVEYLAKLTGRVLPTFSQSQNCCENGENISCINDKIKSNGKDNKRKNVNDAEDEILNGINYKSFENRNGFLRIQLGDQTDSKMLLGQYRCTDVPGEFIWSPGVLTQAVINGFWLLLEDLDCATKDTYTILSNLLENNSLSVPGFRDSIKIAPGFQLFASVRTQKSKNTSHKTIFSLLEKYLYTINILPLSRNELCEIVSENYPKLSTVANRIVDVYLTFSSGDHVVTDNIRYHEFEETHKIKEEYVSLPFDKEVCLTSIPNSGRLVSTRDLVKLCERSNPMFSLTSTECAYFVFQNAVDIFCSYLPQSAEKTKLITGIGAKLGIIPSRCEFFSNEYKPEVQICNNIVKVGRAEVSSKILDVDYFQESIDELGSNLHPHKKLKLSNNNEKMLKLNKSSTFSFTRISLCLLEKISVCISQNEPILLVGETGVGKTSSVQFLARNTDHALVVINMNNQSDVSDLIGGFKPVDLSYVLAPIRSDFEHLFRKTFNETKNEKFLSNISICYNQSNFAVLIQAMLAVVDAVFQRARKGDFKSSQYKGYLNRWRSLQTKLLKLSSQLSKSINISFAFIPGSLVKCIENGDWVLLDEINLASAETLECLSTILEPEGSVILLERGDFTPVKRHPDFRIFACMNPNTDIGKKDLPTGIRNRFTEFFVDELTTESDLMLLVNDYLNSTGIKKTKVLSIVKLYTKLKTLSCLELNDGLGNRPVFSLRTLCRALTITAKNLCGSLERNLYESFCLSFLTQLDLASHNIVLQLIKCAILSDAKSILSQAIPKPDDDYINFEGYWIQKGPKDILECENYILTVSVKQNLKDLARIISIGKLPVLLQGPTSAGKTSLIEYVAKKSGNHCLRINNHEHTDLQEYIGSYVSDVIGKLIFKEGVLAQAMRQGYWIILDELNLASSDILEALNRVLDDNRELFIPETQTVIKAHPNFMLFATQNPPGLYGGRKTLSRAFKNRFIELHFSEIPKAELEIILEKRCLIPKSYAHKMVKCMSDLQVNRKTTTRNNFTLRDLFRWGNRYTYANKQLLENKLYDWNQHLVDEGYLVLSAKVRTEIEVSIIEETLFNNFRKKILIENLYALHENTSLVTRNVLEKIYNYKNRFDIVWTQNMSRMAVLTAKALEFNEPVLLVGPTGCGKTTVCQVLAEISKKDLRTLNCHMHTEGADFLGGLRPCRNQEMENGSKNQNKLFEWSDGPLVISMIDGSYFMADEISLAEDSVLERLNSILEPERTLLLAEKGGVVGDSNNTKILSEEFIIKASESFQFLATMNPGGDFGKKELSPALRNRFTEIWCIPSETVEDLILICSNALKLNFSEDNENKITKISTVIVNVAFYIKRSIEKFKFTVRDMLSWVHYIIQNIQNKEVSLGEIIIFGLETLFLDSLEMLSHEPLEEVDKIRDAIVEFGLSEIRSILGMKVSESDIEKKTGTLVECGTSDRFGIKPFFIKTNPLRVLKEITFLFDAPTTKKNIFRLLSALSVQKAILLEGPPGVGKTSTVENLAHAIGYKIVRINLCEHTDLTDLFGTDLPVEEKALEINLNQDNVTENSNLGSFAWRDGPLLAALKSENTWILLDELNLAPQSVLEGLNAILDHRGEVFIPELNKNFILGKQTRIFACQNPLRQGGGRKGLPQSFLNRFTKVYLRKLNTEDLLFVINKKYAQFFGDLMKHFQEFFKNEQVNAKRINLFDGMQNREKLTAMLDMKDSIKFEIDLSKRMVEFSKRLDKGISELEFGYKGGPFEINLRDILRWCDLLANSDTGFLTTSTITAEESMISQLFKSFDNFLLILYERMKLVYYQRMRSEVDKKFIRDTFSESFNCNAEKLNSLSEDVSLYWTDSAVYLNDIVVKRDSICNLFDNSMEKENEVPQIHNRLFSPVKCIQSYPLILSSQKELLKNLAECVYMEKPVLLCGATDGGKTKIVDALCTLSNQFCNFDTIEDSVMGSFQQIDFNRHLEEVSENVSFIFTLITQKLLLEINDEHLSSNFTDLINLFKLWKEYSDLTEQKNNMDELTLFRQRINNLNKIIEKISTINYSKLFADILKKLQNILLALKHVVRNAESLNTGGYFEWVDSKVVKSVKFGQYICLEHANLCSAAILDRLNPIFEPNGNLLISEKGITSGGNVEIIEKHENFRAFLTMDPKNGELSRAMRNRCIEIYLSKDSYTRDDLRIMIYESGIKEIYFINVLLDIHEELKSLSELSNFSVSHLLQFSFLVSSYKRMECSIKEAIYLSGMEVYVYPSNVDILGYGLLYYQNKMKEIIKAKSDNIQYKEIYGNFDNLVTTSAKLNSLTIIRKLCGPLNIMLKRYSNNETFTKELQEFLYDFKDKDFYGTFDLIKAYMLLIYESSTFDDITKRNEYVQNILQRNKNINELDIKFLTKFCTSLLKAIKGAGNNFKFTSRQLPWNSRLFNRIRDYNGQVYIDKKNELRLSASLHCRSYIEIVLNQNIDKLYKMSAIAYSQAVAQNNMTDTLNNVFLKHLYPFLKNIRGLIISVMDHAELNLERFVTVLVSILWINRLLNYSKECLFKDKMINNNLVDKLILHFKWTDKHLLKFAEKLFPQYSQLNREYSNALYQCANYIKNVSCPLNLIKKTYFKTTNNFSPFYLQQQVYAKNLGNQFESLTALIPVCGNFSQNEILRKFSIIFTDEAEQIKNFLLNNQLEYLKYIQNISDTESHDIIKSIPESLKQSLKNLRLEIIENILEEDKEMDFVNVQCNLQKLKEIYNSEEEDIQQYPNSIEIEVLPLREYYSTKGLVQGNFEIMNLNKIYFEEIPTLNLKARRIVNILSSNYFNKFQTVRNAILNHMETIRTPLEFEDFLKYITVINYKNFNTFHRIVTYLLQHNQLTELSLRREVCNVIKSKNGDICAEITYNGPALTSTILNLALQSEGELKPVALNDLNSWKKSLNDIRQLLWNNSNLILSESKESKEKLKYAFLNSKKLLVELEYIYNVHQTSESEVLSEYDENFKKLFKKLEQHHASASDVLKSDKANMHPSYCIQRNMYHAALLNFIIGCIEILLLTYTPLIDPVEKNILKNEYITQDINCLQTLIEAYDIMRTVVGYKNYASEIYDQIKIKIFACQERKKKLTKQLALRPEECNYSYLVQDINHFLQTNCDPKNFLSLISNVEECWSEVTQEANIDRKLLKIEETIKKLMFWMTNSQRFLLQNLNKYVLYYNDFVQPIKYSIGMIQFGCIGIKNILEQKQKLILLFSAPEQYCYINNNGIIPSILVNLMQFPSTEELYVFNRNSKSPSLQTTSNLFSVLEKFENCDVLYSGLLKAKLLEIKNRLEIASEMNDSVFREFDGILNILNYLWEKQEELRKKKQLEEDNLYVNKTRCQDINEEEEELLEIQENFPTFIEEDFSDFIQQETLEKVIKPSDGEAKSSRMQNIFNDAELKFLGENFIYIMEHFSRFYYYNPVEERAQKSLDFVTPFKKRINVFVKLFNKYKYCVNEWIDELLYNSFGFVIGLQQENLNQIFLKPTSNLEQFNFYKDSNIPEIISCSEVLDQIEIRTKEQLALYPDHAVLNDIIRIIEKIRSLPATSPVVRFNTGFQILRQKVSQWNEVAHKNNHLRDLEAQVAEYVQRWTRLELQFWRNCLLQTNDKVQSNAYKYWFYIFNLLKEYLSGNDIDSTYVDFKAAERKIEEAEVNLEDKKTTEIQISDVVNVLRQFIESSNHADYFIRMKLLRSFEFYLHYINTENTERIDNLIAVIHNLQVYFEQFRSEIEEKLKSIRIPIEKKLRDFVKIESYNKDLSYFSMKNNIARVHRNINKFLKEYESQLKMKISEVFQPKQNSGSDYHLDHDKGINLRYEPKIKYYMIDVKNFVASQKLKNQFLLLDEDITGALLKRVDKLFVTSRNVVKQTISNAEYSSMIYSLDLLLTDQIETCDYLRKLEIDRTQERDKQKAQAKNVLQQKRKALSDLYKTLTELGISYKSGLMELSLESELIDNQIAPFCIKNMFSITKYKKLAQNLIYLSENLDNYFAKCVFKLKLLRNIMLTPNSELGPINIERMKGFSVDMFLLVQKQRKILSESIKELYDLRNVISDTTALLESSKECNFNEEHLDFNETSEKLRNIRISLCKIRYVLEQFIAYMKCCPEKIDEKYLVINSDNLSINRENSKLIIAEDKIQKILQKVKNMLTTICKLSNLHFIGRLKVAKFSEEFQNIFSELIEIKNLFQVRNDEFLPFAKPLIDLINYLSESLNQKNHFDMCSELNAENIDIEIENIIHAILLSLQNILKRHPDNEKENVSQNTSQSKEIEEEQKMYNNHLAEKIHKELCLDLQNLGISNVTKKLSNILLVLKYSTMSNKSDYIKKVASIIPLLEQFNLIGDYFLFQQLGAHKVSAKLLSIMLTVFIELGMKGFCIPPDLMQDEEGEKQKEKGGEGFGLEDGTGENDISDKIESEDQLDDAKRPEDRNGKGEDNQENCKEEKGIEMSEDFEGKLQDIDKPEDDEDDNPEDDNDELNKEMGETEEGADKLDDQIWGSDQDDTNSDEEGDMSEEETGKGSKDEDDKHNDLSSKNDTVEQNKKENKDNGLNATDENNSEKEKKQQRNDIDELKEPEVDEDQINPYHNELEEPPEPEDMELDNNCNLDEDNVGDENKDQSKNPFDIDEMKENMEIQEEEIDSENDEEKKENENDYDEPVSDSEPEAGTNRDDDAVNNDVDDKEDELEEDNGNENDEENNEKHSGEIDSEKEIEESNTEKDENKETQDAEMEDFHQAEDKATKEEMAQPMPNENDSGTKDEIENVQAPEDVKQNEDMDAQDTGEDKKGTGVAENDTSEQGHQGTAETKETKVSEDQKKDRNSMEKRKQGKADEERILGETEKSDIKKLKTIEKLKEQSQEGDNLPDDKEVEAEEYQHVKEPKKNDRTTLDNATEEQSKNMQHLEDEENKDVEDETSDNMLIESDNEHEENLENIPDIQPERSEQKSEKPQKSDSAREKCEALERMEIEGEAVETITVPRSDKTTAHCIKEILMDTSTSEDLSVRESLELRKMYQGQITANKSDFPQRDDYEMWQTISNKMLPNSRELCEQLRLILEPTKCTRLKGDYRTGRRINMKKIIPYIASQFRKDKIWLRRTKPAQRDYKITIAIDDSKSMHHNNSKSLTLEAISLISQALALLESGKLSIVSFGEAPQIILNHTEQFDGPKLVRALNFSQNQSKIAELLNFIRTVNSEEGSSGSGNDLFENLLLILSDGRNIYSEGDQKVRNAIKLARLQRIFLVYVIIDNPDNKHSILDIQVPQFSSDKKAITMKSYLDLFPFPYYIIVRDLGQLPIVLSEAMRQWFELVNSEQ